METFTLTLKASKASGLTVALWCHCWRRRRCGQWLLSYPPLTPRRSVVCSSTACAAGARRGTLSRNKTGAAALFQPLEVFAAVAPSRPRDQLSLRSGCVACLSGLLPPDGALSLRRFWCSSTATRKRKCGYGAMDEQPLGAEWQGDGGGKACKGPNFTSFILSQTNARPPKNKRTNT